MSPRNLTSILLAFLPIVMPSTTQIIPTLRYNILIRSNRPTLLRPPLHIAHDRSLFWHKAFPRAMALLSAPCKHAPKQDRKVYERQPTPNVSLRMDANPLHQLAGSSRFYYNLHRPRSMSSRNPTHISKGYHKFVFEKPLNRLLLQTFPEMPQSPNLQREPLLSYRFHAKRAADNPRLLKEFLNELRRNYHQPMYHEIPPVSLYWNPQSVHRDKHTSKMVNNVPFRKLYPYPEENSNVLPLVLQPTHPTRGKSLKYRALSRESKTRNADLSHNYYKRIIGKRRKSVFHLRNHRVLPKHFKRNDLLKQTSYREIYLKNMKLKPVGMRKRKPWAFYPIRNRQVWRLPQKEPVVPNHPMPYRERYLEMLRQRRIGIQLKSTNKNLRKKHRIVSPHQALKPKRGLGMPMKLQGRQNKPQRNKSSRFLLKRTNDNTHPDFTLLQKSRRQKFSVPKHTTNKQIHHSDLQDRYLGPSKSKYLHLPYGDRNNKTRQRLRALLRSIDWKKIEKDCWQNSGFNKHSKWCQRLTKLQSQRSMTTLKPEELPNIFRKTTLLSPFFLQVTTAVTVTESRSGMTSELARSTPATESPSLTSTVLISDKNSNPQTPSYKQWLKGR